MKDKNWYAVFVVTGEEDKVKERLEFKFKDRIKILVPKRKLKERKNGIWHEKIRILFPGYVLAYGLIETEEYYEMKNTPGMIKLLRSENEPLKIKDEEIELFRHLLFQDQIIGFSDVLIENGNVIVTDGPLTGMEGFIVGINKRKGRAKIMFEFMGEERTVELGINIIQPK